MDLETLWDRVNDAINTIIRRDESTETGDHLQPCIEAALNLGCIPVRASRSQRHNNPRSYLTSKAQEPSSVPTRVLEHTTNEQCSQLPSPQSGDQSAFVRHTTVNFNRSAQSNHPVIQNNNRNAFRSFPFSYDNFSHGGSQMMTMEANTPLKLGSVYPLYHGTHYQTEESHLGFQNSGRANAKTIFVGTPIGTSIPEPAKMGILKNLFSTDGTENALKRITQVDFRDTSEKESETECDLSLQLGLSSDLSTRSEKSLARGTEEIGGSSISQYGGTFINLSPQKNKEFCFFPRMSAHDPFGSSSRKWKSEGECQNMETTVRKRKAPFSNDVEDGQFCWQPDLQTNQFTGQIKWPGL